MWATTDACAATEADRRRVDRRFICEHCGTKWFIHEHRVDEPDLTECARCGGPLLAFISDGPARLWDARDDED
jgi:DNA-directed RNA polymerase subunit RPC12/RpoP